MIAVHSCPKCGSTVSEELAQGECLPCLMQLAIETASPTQTLSGPSELLTVEQLARLLPDFDVLDVLGHGGMGVVYKARQKKLERTVAIKVLSPRLAQDPAVAERFLREAKALAQLHHPHVVTAFDVGDAQGLLYLVMEYVDGADLATYVRSMGPVETQQAVQWILQAAQGFDFAHRKGIIHRDIKPGNLLVDQSGTVKILDLGLARFEQAFTVAGGVPDASLTQTGDMMGTIAFMSPEQAADARNANTRSDIYSLGCTLYFLLTGQRLFPEDTQVKTILAHRERAAPSLRDARPDVPRELDQVFQKMVAKSPANRQASMAEVCTELRACASNRAAGSDREPASGPVACAEEDHATIVYRRGVEQRRMNWRKRLLVGAASGLILGLAVIVYRIQTDHGALLVEVDEAEAAQVTAHLKGGGLEILDKTSGTSWVVKPKQPERAPSGTYQLKPVEGLLLTISNDAGLQLDTDEFTLERGGRVIVRVLLERNATASKPPVAVSTLAKILTSPDWEWTVPENLGAAVNTAGPEMAPHFSADGLRLWFQREHQNPDERACVAERSSPDKPWRPAESVGRAFEFSGPLADFFISRDELTWMFVTWRAQTSGGQQVFESTRLSRQGEWSVPKWVAGERSPALFPVLSEDGLTLYTTNSAHGDDVFVQTRQRTSAPWSEPLRLDAPLNVSGGVRTVWTSADGLVLIFHSARGISDGSTHYDLWLTTRSAPNDTWQDPISFGPTINTAANERGACLSDNGLELVFASDRPGGLGDSDLYVSRRVRKASGP